MPHKYLEIIGKPTTSDHLSDSTGRDISIDSAVTWLLVLDTLVASLHAKFRPEGAARRTLSRIHVAPSVALYPATSYLSPTFSLVLILLYFTSLTPILLLAKEGIPCQLRREMDRLFLDSKGRIPPVTTRHLDDEEPSLEWVGINGSCNRIPDNALACQDDLSYLNTSEFLDQYGLRTGIDWARDVDWHRKEHHARAFLPLFAPNVASAPWYQALWTKIPSERTHDGQYRFLEADVLVLLRDLRSFHNLLNAVVEHPKYDLYIDSPAEFDSGTLTETWDSDALLQKVAAEAKRAALDIWAHLAWWTASVSDWRNGLSAEVIQKLTELDFAATAKRGVLVCPVQDWPELNFPLLCCNNVPVYYVWGTLEQHDKRFTCLDSELWKGYHQECQLYKVESMTGEEVAHLSRSFEVCARYTPYLDVVNDPVSKPVAAVPEGTSTSGLIRYEVKDFETWGRRRLSEDENWRVLDKFYHHVVVEEAHSRCTIVVFHRFHPKPKEEVMDQEGNFMEEDTPEPERCEVRERFKARCAPQMGQKFDPITGVECQKPFEGEGPEVVERFERDLMLVAPPDRLGGQEIRGRRSRFHPDADSTKIGRSVGPRYTSPNSDHSSERREEDSSEPMAHVSRWIEAMTKPDNVGNYVQNRNGCMNNHRGGNSRRRVRSPSPAFTDARSIPFIPFAPNPNRRKLTMEETDQMRVNWLNNFRDWGINLSYEHCLWRIPCEFKWSPKFLTDAYIILSETSEVRLRYLTTVDPGIRFPQHVVEIAIEHGIHFKLGVKKTALEMYCPSEGNFSRSLMKARIATPERRLTVDGSNTSILGRWLSIVGVVFDKPGAVSVIPRGGGAQWIARAFNYGGLIQAYMQGPSIALSVFHHGGDDSGEDDCLNLHWDKLAKEDYQNIFGKDWKIYFHTVNHGRLAPKQIINNMFIEEGSELGGSVAHPVYHPEPPFNRSLLKLLFFLKRQKLGGFVKQGKYSLIEVPELLRSILYISEGIPSETRRSCR
ncbi:hypothetical protein B0H13DRAFT_1910132 [Mycena leptocephala]|nr:hypothetical protein B0H13DRAFT_1910132 [Mycena leptocephala]